MQRPFLGNGQLSPSVDSYTLSGIVLFAGVSFSYNSLFFTSATKPDSEDNFAQLSISEYVNILPINFWSKARQQNVVILEN